METNNCRCGVLFLELRNLNIYELSNRKCKELYTIRVFWSNDIKQKDQRERILPNIQENLEPIMLERPKEKTFRRKGMVNIAKMIQRPVGEEKASTYLTSGNLYWEWEIGYRKRGIE